MKFTEHFYNAIIFVEIMFNKDYSDYNIYSGSNKGNSIVIIYR